MIGVLRTLLALNFTFLRSKHEQGMGLKRDGAPDLPKITGNVLFQLRTVKQDMTKAHENHFLGRDNCLKIEQILLLAI